MLNPSTADDTTDDPTIRKCTGFARLHSFAAIEVVNLCAWRATDPKALFRRLRTHGDVSGPRNMDVMKEAVEASARIVAAWGAHGARRQLEGRVDEVLTALRGVDLYVLGLTSAGHANAHARRQPRHPLMLSYDTPMTLWRAGEG